MHPVESKEEEDDDDEDGSSCPAFRVKPKLVKPEYRSVLQQMHDRHLNHSSEVMPDAQEPLETVPEVEFETPNFIARRKSLLFLDLAIIPSQRSIASISPPKISSIEAARATIPVFDDTPTASSAAAMESPTRSRAATFDGVITREIDKDASSPFVPVSTSRRNQDQHQDQDQDPEVDLPKFSTGVHRMPYSKLRSPSVQAASNHRTLTAMFGAFSSPRSDTMSPRTPIRDDVAIASPASNLRPPSIAPLVPSAQTPSNGLLASLFGPMLHREESSRSDFEHENADPLQSMLLQSSQKSDISLHSSFESLVDLIGALPAPAAGDVDFLNSLSALVPSPCTFNDESAIGSPAALPLAASILSTISRQCSLNSIASLILPAPAVSLLASLFGSLSISEKENDQSPIDQVIAQSTLSQSQKSIGSTASLVNPSALKGLGLGRRSSFMTPRTPHPIEEHEDDTKKNPSSVVASSSDPLQAVVATDDTDDHDDMSFDTAPFDIDDYFKDPAPAPVPTGVPSPWMTPAVLNPPQHASKPIWLTHESTEQRGDERDHVNNNNNNNNSNNRMLGKPTATLLARGTAAALHPRVSRTSRTQATADEKKSSGRKGGGTAHAHEYLKKGEGVTATATATAKLQADGPYKKRKKMTQL